jgi:DNA topoisomerase-1
MRIAQQLYEGVKLSSKEGEVGLITYMRTDSLNISDEAREAARRLIVSRYGGDFYPTKPNFYRTKAKGAQEAHEAIRPTDPARTPEDVRPYLSPQQFNVYRLIWQRFVASQMAQAVFDVTQVDILGTPKQSDTAYTFRASGSVIRFPGFLEVYREGRDAGDGDDEIDKDALPALSPDEPVDLVSLVPEQHWTQPPPRYTEASLVKALEELGIGRPSTYAPTIATILNRNYVTKDEKVLVPSELGTIVTDVLVKNFADIVDYGFTSQMEERLDAVAEGTTAWVPLLHQFYGPFDANAKKAEADGGAVKGEQTDEICEVCGKPMVIRVSRYGRFLSCSGYPECKNTRPLDGSGAPPQYEKVPDGPTDDICPTCGKPMVVKTGRYGRFIACVDYPTCKTSKKIEVTTGVHCPQCATGELVQRKTRKGNRVFWGCNRYPDCDYTTNTDPRKVAPAPVAMLAD